MKSTPPLLRHTNHPPFYLNPMPSLLFHLPFRSLEVIFPFLDTATREFVIILFAGFDD